MYKRQVHLDAFQREREGGTPIVWPRGLERALSDFRPTVVVAWEYGPTALRSWAWCARRRVPLVLFSENTPHIEERLPAAQLRLHRWLAGRAKGFIAASSAARERFLALGAAPDAVEVSLQSFDPEPIRAARPASQRWSRSWAAGSRSSIHGVFSLKITSGT